MSDIEDRDPRETFLRLWRYRRWILGSTVVVASGFAIAALVITPVYRATTVLISASTGRPSLSNSVGSAFGDLGGIASAVGISLGDSDTGTQEAIAVLGSRQFTEQFMVDNRLLPVLFSSDWNAQAGSWRVPIGDQPTLGDAYKLFDDDLRSITLDKKTKLITLQIDWRDPKLAAAWANQLVDRLNHEMRSRAMVQADKSLKFLNSELAQTSETSTRASINKLIEMQIQQRMFANVTEEFAFRVVDRALPPDKWDKVRPKRLLLIISGMVLGLVIGMLIAAIHSSLAGRAGMSARSVRPS